MADRTVVYKAIGDYGSLIAGAKQAESALKGMKKAGDDVGRSSSQLGKPAAQLSKTNQQLKQVNATGSRTSSILTSLGSQAAYAAGGLGEGSSAAAGFASSLADMGGPATKILGTLGAIGAAAAAVGIAFNAQKESSLIAFESILKDGAKAQDLMARIIETARVTPFETTTLVSGVRQLLAYGLDINQVLKGSGEEATGLAITLGNAVSAMGGSQEMLQQVIRATGQMFTKGKVSAEEMRQLAEAGIPVYDILSEKLGIAKSEISDIGKLGVTAERGIAALAEGLNERFGGAMAAQSKTFQGLVSTLKDNVQIGLGLATETLFTKMKGILSGVGNFLTELNTIAQEKGFIEAFKEMVPAAAGFLDDLMRAADGIRRVFIAIQPFISAFVSTMARLAGGAAAAGIKVLVVVFETLATVLEAIPSEALEVAATLLVVYAAVRKLMILAVAAKSVAALTVALNGLRTVSALTSLAFGSLASGQGLKGFLSLLRPAQGSIAGAATAMTGLSVATLGVGAAAAVAVGSILWMNKKAQDALEAHDSLGESADNLIEKLGLETTAFNNVSAAAEGTEEALNDLDYAAEFSTLIDDLREASDAAAEALLIDFAVSLRIKGVGEEDIKEQVERLAETAGVAIPVVPELTDPQTFIDSFASQGERAATEWAERFNRKMGAEAVEGLAFGITGPQKEDLEATAQQIQDMFNVDPQAAFAGIDAFVTSIRNSGLATTDANGIIAEFFRQLREVDTFTNDSNGLNNYSGYLQTIADKASGVPEPVRRIAEQILAASDATKGGDFALGQYNYRLTELPGDAAAAADAVEGDLDPALEGMEDQTNDNSAALERLAEETKAYEEAISDVADSLGSFTEPADVMMGVFDEITDKQQEAAEKAAVAAGFGEEAWRDFALGVTVSLDDMAARLELSAANQVAWMDNLQTISARFGPDVADQLREMGPEMAGVVDEMANDTTGAADRLAEALRADAALGGEAMAEEFQTAIDANAAILENPDLDSAAMITAVRQPFQDLKVAIERWGTDSARAWAASISSTLSATTIMGPALNNRIMPGPPAQTPKGASRNGNIWPAANGLLSQAHIQTGNSQPLYQWAEPGTGGEAFIPLGEKNRARSLKIWAAVGDVLLHGGQPKKMAQGGLPNIYRSPNHSITTDFTQRNQDRASGTVDWEGLFKLINDMQKNRMDFEFDALGSADKVRLYTKELQDLEKQGLKWSDGWIQAMNERKALMEELQGEAEDAANKLAGLLEEQKRAQLQRDEAIKRSNDEKAKNNKELQEGLAELEEERLARLADIAEREQNAIDQATETYTSAMKARADATAAMLNPMEKIAPAWANSTQAIIDNFQKQNEAMQDWRDGLANLKGRGFSDELIAALGLNDPRQLAQVESLLGSSQEDLQAIIQSYIERGNISSDVANLMGGDLAEQLADSIAEAGTEASQSRDELAADVAEQRADLLARHKETLDEINLQLKEAMKEYNDTIKEIGYNTGLSYSQLLSQGLKSGLPLIVQAAKDLQKGLAAAKTGGVTINIGSIPTNHSGGIVGVPGSSSDEVLRILQKGEGIISRDHMRAFAQSRFSGVPQDTMSETPVEVYLDGDLISRSVVRRQSKQARNVGLHTGRRVGTGG